MTIDKSNLEGTLTGETTDEREEGKGNRVHLRAPDVRAQVGAPPSAPVRADRPGQLPERLPEVQEPGLEPAREVGTQAANQTRVAPRRDDHLRVTCNHCGARVRTRISGAMWGHTDAGSECPGSKTWDHDG
jgi:hypothetical protein